MRFLTIICLALAVVSARAQQSTMGNSAFLYGTNETHTLQFVTTNTLWVAGGGDTGANSANGGPYILKTPIVTVAVYTNTAGTFGITFDPGAFNLPNEEQITNSAGSLRYHTNVLGGTFPNAGIWAVDSGTGPGPTVVVGTNSVTTNVIAYYPLPNVGPPGVSIGTNVYFVNPVTGNDTNAVPGRRDRPYQYLTNLLINIAIATNSIVYLEPGTNQFGAVNLVMSNGVSIIGLGNRDSCWIAKDPSKVDAGDINLTPGSGSLLENFSGNITFQFGTANVTFRNVHTIGQIDNFQPSGSNVVADSCIFEVNGQDSQPLIDAAVIAGGSTTAKNCIFASRRRGNGATTRRALCIKGGTNTIIGCTLIATDSTNNAANAFGCIGLYTEGNGYDYISGCATIVGNTNTGNAFGYTNGFAGGGMTLGGGPLSLVYSNGAVLGWESPLTANFGQQAWNTNLINVGFAPDFNVSVSTLSTNNHVQFLAPTNVDISKTLLQQSTVFVTNTTASLKSIVASFTGVTTNNAGTVNNVTNLTEVTFKQYGQKWTNMFCRPIF